VITSDVFGGGIEAVLERVEARERQLLDKRLDRRLVVVEKAVDREPLGAHLASDALNERDNLNGQAGLVGDGEAGRDERARAHGERRVGLHERAQIKLAEKTGTTNFGKERAKRVARVERHDLGARALGTKQTVGGRREGDDANGTKSGIVDGFGQ
jgi:hypothetical protein